MLKSVSYQDDLMEFLKKPEAAAAYIEAILEEKDVETELLSLALSNMVEASGGIIQLSDIAKLHYEKLKNLLSETGGDEVYLLVALLDALGFQLKIGVKSDSLTFEAERAIAAADHLPTVAPMRQP